MNDQTNIKTLELTFDQGNLDDFRTALMVTGGILSLYIVVSWLVVMAGAL